MSDSWSGSFFIWVVYQNPSDFPPGTFVARKWRIMGGPTSIYMVSTEYHNIRNNLQEMKLTRIGRHKTDDPCILESWI